VFELKYEKGDRRWRSTVQTSQILRLDTIGKQEDKVTECLKQPGTPPL
jgi:hypothetical protein